MELQPANIDQIRMGRDGRIHHVEDDVGNVVREIKAIDSKLSVHWRERGEYYAVVEMCEDGAERLVTTVRGRVLDPRLADRVRRLVSPGYDYVKEVDRIDAEADKAIDHKFKEEVGERGEKLAHALRKDLEVKNKIILPSEVNHVRKLKP